MLAAAGVGVKPRQRQWYRAPHPGVAHVIVPSSLSPIGASLVVLMPHAHIARPHNLFSRLDRSTGSMGGGAGSAKGGRAYSGPVYGATSVPLVTMGAAIEAAAGCGGFVRTIDGAALLSGDTYMAAKTAGDSPGVGFLVCADVNISAANCRRMLATASAGAPYAGNDDDDDDDADAAGL